MKRLYNKLVFWIKRKLLEREYKKVSLQIEKLKSTKDMKLIANKKREAIDLFKELKKFDK